jgi:HrpA-like RNA helicase
MTQPRVLAATSNASRISQELLAQINDPSFTLGYKV